MGACICSLDPDSDSVDLDECVVIDVAETRTPVEHSQIARVAFLKEVLANQTLLRTAFEHVARSAGCTREACVERLPFLRALTRVIMHFNPTDKLLVPTSAQGPPYSREEAYHYFCAALCLLMEKLEIAASDHDRLSGLLKASRMRITGLRLALECEEVSLREQSERIASLVNTVHELEEQEGKLDKNVMTLEDLKQHVSVAHSLKGSVAEIEKMLDEREDRIMSLLEELEKRSK